MSNGKYTQRAKSTLRKGGSDSENIIRKAVRVPKQMPELHSSFLRLLNSKTVDEIEQRGEEYLTFCDRERIDDEMFRKICLLLDAAGGKHVNEGMGLCEWSLVVWITPRGHKEAVDYGEMVVAEYEEGERLLTTENTAKLRYDMREDRENPLQYKHMEEVVTSNPKLKAILYGIIGYAYDEMYEFLNNK